MTGNSPQATGVYTYDHLPVYVRVVYRGDEAYVIEKDELGQNRHITIQFPDGEKKIIHERAVNNYLSKRENLWVDWDWRLESGQDISEYVCQA